MEVLLLIEVARSPVRERKIKHWPIISELLLVPIQEVEIKILYITTEVLTNEISVRSVFNRIPVPGSRRFPVGPSFVVLAGQNYIPIQLGKKYTRLLHCSICAYTRDGHSHWCNTYSCSRGHNL